MTDFILHAVLFVAWLAYNFPPLVASKSEAAQVVRVIICAVMGACVGFGFGQSFTEVFWG